MKGHCILSHGFESGPDATKVTALAEAAERLGWTHERPDYTDLDAKREVSQFGDVLARLQRLQQLAHDASTHGPLVLAGSSLGAWISARVSLEVPLRGLFLESAILQATTKTVKDYVQPLVVVALAREVVFFAAFLVVVLVRLAAVRVRLAAVVTSLAAVSASMRTSFSRCARIA